MSTRQFPDLIEAYIKFTSGHESTDRVRKWSFIAILAAALERKVYIDRAYYTLFPNLYVFIIGRSGLIKKSTSTSIAVNLLREVPGIRFMSERMTAASLIRQMAIAGKYYDAGGTRTKQSPLFAYASELAVFMTDVFGSTTELLTTFYDCQPNDSTKPWIHQTIGDGKIQIFGPCLNILGASTKTWLTKCIPKTEMEGGFTSRVVFVVENRLPEKLIAWPELDTNFQKMRERLIADLVDLSTLNGAMQISAPAKKYFTEWYQHHMTEVLPNNLDPRMVGYMSRKGDTILKLAMIKSAAESNDLMMRVSHLEWAKAEMDELEMDWRGAFDGLGLQKGLAWDLRNFVRTRGNVTKGELLKVFSSQYPVGEIIREMTELADMGDVIEYPSIMGADAGYKFMGA